MYVGVALKQHVNKLWTNCLTGSKYLHTGDTKRHLMSWYKPASHNDDILGDVGHLFDGQVAHPPQGLLKEKARV